MARTTARQAHAAYSEARGRAMGASTLWLRWQARRLPKHSDNEQEAAQVKAIRDELRDRGEGDDR